MMQQPPSHVVACSPRRCHRSRPLTGQSDIKGFGTKSILFSNVQEYLGAMSPPQMEAKLDANAFPAFHDLLQACEDSCLLS